MINANTLKHVLEGQRGKKSKVKPCSTYLKLICDVKYTEFLLHFQFIKSYLNDMLIILKFL